MADPKQEYADNYTKAHMKRDVYELAKVRAKANNRTVANYLAHLVQTEADQAKQNEQRDTLQTQPPVIAHIPGSEAK